MRYPWYSLVQDVRQLVLAGTQFKNTVSRVEIKHTAHWRGVISGVGTTGAPGAGAPL